MKGTQDCWGGGDDDEGCWGAAADVNEHKNVSLRWFRLNGRLEERCSPEISLNAKSKSRADEAVFGDWTTPDDGPANDEVGSLAFQSSADNLAS